VREQCRLLPPVMKDHSDAILETATGQEQQQLLQPVNPAQLASTQLCRQSLVLHASMQFVPIAVVRCFAGAWRCCA
jgi:hypothetical protein